MLYTKTHTTIVNTQDNILINEIAKTIITSQETKRTTFEGDLYYFEILGSYYQDSDYCIDIKMQNKSDRAMEISVHEGYINSIRKTITPFLRASVPAYTTVTDKIVLSEHSMQYNNISSIYSIQCSFIIRSKEDWFDIIDITKTKTIVP